jgi:hypothetical protein
MKKLSALICGLLLSAMPSIVHAQAAAGAYKIDKITPAIVPTPQYSAGEQHSGGGQQPGKWLEVEVQFESLVDITDEITFKYYILVGDTLLSGEVTHVDVPKGRELYSVMYVSPRSLARLLPVATPITPNAIRVVGVQMLIKGQLIDEKSSKPGGDQDWFQKMQQTPGMVLNKSETPFAPLDWDRYEAVKTTH